jgi:hypothetical protein
VSSVKWHTECIHISNFKIIQMVEGTAMQLLKQMTHQHTTQSVTAERSHHHTVRLMTGPEPLPKQVLVLPLSICSIFLFPWGHPGAAYVFFVFPSLLTFLQQHVLEGSS